MGPSEAPELYRIFEIVDQCDLDCWDVCFLNFILFSSNDLLYRKFDSLGGADFVFVQGLPFVRAP